MFELSSDPNVYRALIGALIALVGWWIRISVMSLMRSWGKMERRLDEQEQTIVDVREKIAFMQGSQSGSS